MMNEGGGMSNGLNVIVGLGLTGMACARFLASQGIPFAVNDTRLAPPQLTAFKDLFPDAVLSLGRFDRHLLSQADRLIVSPGVSIKEAEMMIPILRGVPVIGEIELFAQYTQKPVVAITGTNAKSTVTTLVGQMAEAAGFKVAVGGNLGTPALDLFMEGEPELYVLELSSFQLETTDSLAPKVASILNITPDHLDRYASYEDYIQAKQRIYHRAHIAVCNRDDDQTHCEGVQKIAFTLSEPGENEFGLLEKNKETYLAYQDEILMSVRTLPILGRHYQANALAALAIGMGLGLPMEPMLATLAAFKGLAHRCQWIREHKGVAWYNDSKGTNVGATLAAIMGLGSVISGKLILILGGVGKNADFSPLVEPIRNYVKTVILIGEAAQEIARAMGSVAQIRFASSMEEAVIFADEAAISHDSVLLSPACASFDMFKNYEHRGQVFTALVRELT